MHPQTLRIYETKGLVRPQRTPGNTRLYSERDLERLRTIQALTQLGLNLVGVEQVLSLQDEVRGLRSRIDRLEAEKREAVDHVHKQYRRELVLYAAPSRLPVRWTSTS